LRNLWRSARPGELLEEVSSQKQKKSSIKKPPADFEFVRSIMLALPGVVEGTSYGTPAFRVARKFLARLHEDGESLVLGVDYSTREILTGSDPDTFYFTEHYRCYPLMLIRLSRVPRDVLENLLEEAWRRTATKRLLAQRDAQKNSAIKPGRK
jgi:hypothetical protein